MITTDSVIQSVKNELEKPESTTIVVNKTQMRMILNKLNLLESVAASLLRSQVNAGIAHKISLPYKTKEQAS